MKTEKKELLTKINVKIRIEILRFHSHVRQRTRECISLRQNAVELLLRE